MTTPRSRLNLLLSKTTLWSSPPTQKLVDCDDALTPLRSLLCLHTRVQLKNIFLTTPSLIWSKSSFPLVPEQLRFPSSSGWNTACTIFHAKTPTLLLLLFNFTASCKKLSPSSPSMSPPSPTKLDVWKEVNPPSCPKLKFVADLPKLQCRPELSELRRRVLYAAKTHTRVFLDAPKCAHFCHCYSSS